MKRKKSVIILSAAVAAVLIFVLLSKLNISFGTLVKRVDFKKETSFKSFTVENDKIGSNYIIRFKDLTSGTGDTEQRFYKVDLTLILTDKKSQKNISNNARVAGALIAGTMANFKVSDVNTPKGKQFLKSTIQKNLENKFGGNMIKEIYFENFVYN